MSRVNLLPSEIKRGQRSRQRTLLVLLGGFVVFVLIILIWVVQGFSLTGVNDEIEAQNATNASLQQAIAELQQFEDLQTRAQQKEQLLSTAYAGEVAYSSVLVDISRVIPSDTYLSSLNVTNTGATGAPTGDTTSTEDTTSTSGASFVGSMTFSGATLHFDSLSTWLTRLEAVEGWANPWTSNINQDATTPGAFTSDSSVDLTSDALTQRGRGVPGG